MTTDGGGYTYYPCNTGSAACPSVSQTNVADGCTAVGLNMVIPRTQNHWTSMISFVKTTLGGSASTYFPVIPGVSKSTGGYNGCIGSIMNYDNCQGTAVVVGRVATGRDQPGGTREPPAFRLRAELQLLPCSQPLAVLLLTP